MNLISIAYQKDSSGHLVQLVFIDLMFNLEPGNNLYITKFSNDYNIENDQQLFLNSNTFTDKVFNFASFVLIYSENAQLMFWGQI